MPTGEDAFVGADGVTILSSLEDEFDALLQLDDTPVQGSVTSGRSSRTHRTSHRSSSGGTMSSSRLGVAAATSASARPVDLRVNTSSFGGGSSLRGDVSALTGPRSSLAGASAHSRPGKPKLPSDYTSKSISILRLSVDDEYCFGLVGERKLCLRPQTCNLRGHEKKFIFPDNEIFCVPAKLKKDRREAFKVPSIPTRHVRPEFLKDISTPKPTADMMDAVQRAIEGWQTYLRTVPSRRARAGGLGGGGDGDDPSGSDDSSSRSSSNFLGSGGSGFGSVGRGEDTDSASRPPPDITIIPLFDGGDPIPVDPHPELAEALDEEDDLVPTLAETRRALQDALATMGEVAAAVPRMGEAAVHHLQPTLEELLPKVDKASQLALEIAGLVGDWGEVQQSMGNKDLSNAMLDLQAKVHKALGQLQKTVITLDNLEAKLDHASAGLDGKIREALLAFGRASRKSSQAIFDRVKQVEARVPSGGSIPGGGSSVGSNRSTTSSQRSDRHQRQPRHSLGAPHVGATVPVLTMDTVIQDSAGQTVCTIGHLVRQEEAHAQSITDLKAQMESNGGVVWREWTFATEADLKRWLLAEDPSAKSFAGVVDIMSYFVHDIEYKLDTPELLKARIKALTEAGLKTEAERLYARSFFIRSVWHFTHGEEFTPEKPCRALKTLEAWKGANQVPGAKKTIQKSLGRAKPKLKSYIQTNMKSGGDLSTLAKECMVATEEFVDALLTHIDDEISDLIEMKLKPTDCLGLVTSEIFQMQDKMAKERMMALEYTSDLKPVDYMTRTVWVTLRCHMIMDEYLQDGIKNHYAIASSFIRFLTAQTGSNSAAGVRSEMTKEFSAVRKEIKGAETAAASAGSKANQAITAANETANKLTKAMQKNNLKLP